MSLLPLTYIFSFPPIIQALYFYLSFIIGVAGINKTRLRILKSYFGEL